MNHATHPSWLDLLKQLAPPTGLCHIGAGSGVAAARYALWQVPQVVLVEADDVQFKKLKQAVGLYDGWEAHLAVLAECAGSAHFYRASNPAESSLLAPLALQALWRNLQSEAQLSCTTTTVDALLVGRENPCNWLVVDCLPALPIVQGAVQSLAAVDILLARVLVAADVLPGLGATHAELDSFLAAQGFTCLFTEEERHPALATVAYARPWRSQHQRALAQGIAQNKGLQTQLAQSLQTHAEMAQQLAERQVQIEQLTVARDEQSQLAAAGQAELAQARQTHAELAQQLAERQGQIEQLTVARDEQSQLAAAGQAQLAQSHAEMAQQLAEHQVQIEQLTAARDEQSQLAARERDSLQAEWAQAKAVAAQELAARDASIVQITAQRDEQAHWHQENAKWAQALKAETETLAACVADWERTTALATEERNQLQQARTAQDKELERLAQALAEARQTTALSVKLLTLREADLRDLQQRYAATLAEQQSQHNLLTKLAQRLTAANQYFQLLQAQQVASLSQPAAAPARLAVTPKTPARRPPQGHSRAKQGAAPQTAKAPVGAPPGEAASTASPSKKPPAVANKPARKRAKPAAAPTADPSNPL